LDISQYNAIAGLG